jgi:hypothetical protein
MALDFSAFASAFRLGYGPAYRRFLNDLRAPQQAQSRLLGELVFAMSRTRYGAEHGLRAKDGYAEFARKLPMVDYEAISPWIERQRRSPGRVMSPAPVAFYERTSGSCGASKLIPYTAGLQMSFVRMFLLWACDCLEHGPRLSSGRTFLSVSPLLPDQGTLPDDTEYLPAALRWLFGRYLVLPRGLRGITEPMLFKRILAAHLLSEPHLEVISVWNPSYFSSLLDFIEGNRDRIAADLRAGEIDAGSRRFRFRRVELGAGALDFTAIWPRLRLLSCWTDGNAALVCEPLRRRLPHAALQGKGLIATEAPMTIPLWHSDAPVPLLGELFFEFVSDDGDVRLLHELEVGRQYELVVSQRGGLARYRIGDRIEVAGRFHATPTLRFVGRARQVSDLVGEKLNENFVRDALNRLGGMAGSRWMLLPTIREGRARYLCLFDGSPAEQGLGAMIDEALQQAHHYRLARQLGQLEPVAVQRKARLDDAYLAWNAAEGRKWGNVKPSALLTDVARAQSFERYLQRA